MAICDGCHKEEAENNFCEACFQEWNESNIIYRKYLNMIAENERLKSELGEALVRKATDEEIATMFD